MERRKFTREFKLEAVRLIRDRGVSYVQASQELGVHPSQLHDWVKKFSDDPQHAVPGHGQMKPEQLEIARLKREVSHSPTRLRGWPGPSWSAARDAKSRSYSWQRERRQQTDRQHQLARA